MKEIVERQTKRLKIYQALQDHLDSARKNCTLEGIRVTEKWVRDTIKKHGLKYEKR